jgi:hypothetical protein
VSITIGPFVTGEVPPPLEYQFLDATGQPINLSGPFSAQFRYQEHWAAYGSGVATITDAAAGKVTYIWTGNELTTPGQYAAEFWVGNNTNRYASELLEFTVRASVGPWPTI